MNTFVTLVEKMYDSRKESANHNNYDAVHMHLLKKFCGTEKNPIVDNVIRPEIHDDKLSGLIGIGHGRSEAEHGSGMDRKVSHAEYAVHALASYSSVPLVNESGSPYGDIWRMLSESGNFMFKGIDDTVKMADGLISYIRGHRSICSVDVGIESVVRGVSKTKSGIYYGDVTVILSKTIGRGSSFIQGNPTPSSVPSTRGAISYGSSTLLNLREKIEAAVSNLRIAANELKNDRPQIVLTIKNV